MNDSRPHDPHVPASLSPVEALNRTIEALEARLDDLISAKRAPQPAAAARPEPTRAPVAPTPAAPAAPLAAASREDAVSQVLERQRRLEAVRARAAQSRLAPEMRPLHVSPPPVAPAPVPAAAPAKAEPVQPADSDLRDVAQALVALRRELRADLRRDLGEDFGKEFAALRGDMAAMQALAERGQVTDKLRGDLERINAGLTDIGRAMEADDPAALLAEMDALRHMVEGTAREESLRGLDTRWSEICDLVTEIDPGAVRDELVVLSTRLDEIRAAIGQLPAASDPEIGEQLHAIEAALAHLAREDASPRHEADFQRLDRRLDEIAKAVLAANVSSDGAAQKLAMERMEARLAQLADKIAETEGAAARALTPHLERLAHRIEGLGTGTDNAHLIESLDQLSAQIAEGIPHDGLRTIASHLEDLSAKVEALGAGAAVAPAAQSDAALLDRFEALIERAERGEAERQWPGLDVLQRQLDVITDKLDVPAGNGLASDDAIRSLESQIANLSSLMSATAAVPSGMEAIEPRLAAIETHLSRSHEDVVAAASRAAEAAVTSFLQNGAEDFDAPSDELATITALADDLRSLERLTRLSDERNARTFDAVHDTLLKIADRLESLDRHRPMMPAATLPPQFDDADMQAEAPPLDAHRQVEDDAPVAHASFDAPMTGAASLAAVTAAPVQEPAPRSLLGRLTERVRPKREAAARAEPEMATTLDPRAHVEPTPPIDPSETLDAGAANQPLEPGSGTPDIGRILQKVREQQSAGVRSGTTTYTETEKADFIAAARRAAQAAAAEVENANRSLSGRTGGTAPLGNQSRRRPVLIAIGAVLLAIMSYPIVSDMVAPDAPAPELAMADVAAPSPDTALPELETEADATASVTPEPESIPAADSVAMEPEIGPVVMEDQGVTPPVTEPAEPAPAAAAIVAEEMNAAPAEGRNVVEPEAVAATDDTFDPAADPVDAAVAGSNPSGAETAPNITETTEEDAADAPLSDAMLAEIDALPAEMGTLTLRQAARSGDPLALFEIGARYTEGRGTEPDPAEAADWYRASAERGFAPAQYRLGNLLEKGAGVERDLDEAKQLYEEAARQGNASAMHNLAVLHAMNGSAGDADYAAAAGWFEEAAELGVRDSQFNLAILYARGSGVEQDLTQSYKWFAIAAREGDTDAAAKRDEVANAMEADQLDAARAEVELWQPAPLDPEANVIDVPEEWGTSDTRTATVDMTKAVRNIQVILNNSGFDAGPPDGIMGERTVNAIKAFQTAEKLEPTGEIDDQLVRALLARNS